MMTTSNLALFVLMLFIAGSYGWAVRGTTLGKETGAMLPGALLGILCAWFSGSALLWENFWIFCAAGALGMFVGGTETYGETIGLVTGAKPPPEPVRGYMGLALKGLLWFGIAGAFLGLAFTAVTGSVYTVRDFIWLFAPMPFLWALGVAAFNRPHRPKEGKLPKIYFSKTRVEVWGGMAAMLLSLLVFLLVKGDRFALFLCAGGAIGGAIGWALGIWLFQLSLYPLRNGKYLFGTLRTKGMIDGWKIMENTLGAVGFLGIGAGFVLGYPLLQERIAALERIGTLWNPLGERQELLSWGMLLLITVGEALLGGVYLLWLKKTKYGDAYLSAVHKSLYTYLSLPLVYLGAVRYARLVSVFLIYLPLVIKMMGGNKRKSSLAYKMPIALSLVALLLAEIFWGERFTVLYPWILYTLVYFGFEFLRTLPPGKEKKKPRSSLITVEGFKAAGIIALWIFACEYFW